MLAAACREPPPTDRVRVSGQVEATDVQVAAPVGGRVLELGVAEGQRVEAGALVARLDTADAELALARARAERDQADAQLRLLRAGSRAEDIRQAEAQVAAGRRRRRRRRRGARGGANDVDRFEALLASNSGSRKQRDDAVARRDVARERVRAPRTTACRAATAKRSRGCAPGRGREEIAAARGPRRRRRRADRDLEKAIADATVTAPIAGIVTEKIADVGEIVAAARAARRSSPISITPGRTSTSTSRSCRACASASRPRSSPTPAAPASPARSAYISAKAEFTPRNVQTAEDRSKLVYRVKVVGRQHERRAEAGMPVEAEISLCQP